MGFTPFFFAKEGKYMNESPCLRYSEDKNPYLEGTKEEFISNNLGLVRHICYKHFSPQLIEKRVGTLADMEDLVSIGTIGLLKAYKNFDPTKFSTETDMKFSTYAYPTIRGEVLRFLRDSNKGIKISRNEKLDYQEIVTQGLEKEHPEVIAEKLGISISRVCNAIESSGVKLRSINAEMPGKDGTTLSIGDTLADHTTEGRYNTVVAYEFLNSLPERLKEVSLLYYEQGYTQIEIAKKLEISQVQVSRRLAKAMKFATQYLEKVEENKDMYSKAGIEARKLLLDTDMTISEISKQTGLSRSSVWQHSKELRPESVIKIDDSQIKGSFPKLQKKKQEKPIEDKEEICPKKVVEQKTEEILEAKTSCQTPSSITLDRNIVEETLGGTFEKFPNRELQMVLDISQIPLEQAHKELNRYICALKFLGITKMNMRLQAMEEETNE